MKFLNIGRMAAFALALFPALLSSAMAQEISESHLKAAAEAVKAIKATDQFDAILPRAADALRGELLKKDPNLSDQINAIVTDKTIALAGRRADLETEAARVYARVFTEEELNAITAFYTGPAGQKLIKEGTILVRELVKAANIWQEGIARDLAGSVGEELQKISPAAAPAEGEAPKP